MEGQRYEKIDARIGAARIACGVLGRLKDDGEARTGFELFKQVYEYMKKELEEGIV